MSDEHKPLDPEIEARYRAAVSKSFFAHLGGPKGLASHPVSRGPDFMCIGAQKAATTWLQHNLGFHPHVFVPCVKELFYFSEIHFRNFGDAARLRRDEIEYVRLHFAEKFEVEEPDRIKELEHLENFELSDDWYKREFAFARNYQVSLEVDPTTGLIPFSGIRHVLTLNPNVKFIVVLRDPAERALSQLRMELGAVDFALYEERIRSFPYDMAFYYSDYPSWIGRWVALASVERILFLDFEDIRSHPLAALERACGFMGVEFDRELFPNAQLARNRAMESSSQSLELLKTLRAALRPVYDRLHALPIEFG